ncbi:LOW QUALITY PROTEIN: protein lin-12-like [Pangshura tecta]
MRVHPGKNCQLMDFCPTKPCTNGGTYPRIVCQCRPGFDGLTCQHNVNESWDPRPCTNGGTCLNSLGSFRCPRPPVPAPRRALPRRAGSAWRDLPPLAGSYHGCQCPPGYMGQLCGVNPDHCVGHHCRKGGGCQDGVGTYSCLCPPGWTGLLCHLSDACLSSPCHVEASCDTNPLTGSAVCVCQPGYARPTCHQALHERQLGEWGPGWAQAAGFRQGTMSCVSLPACHGNGTL